MTAQLDVLWRPLLVGGVTVPNRICVSAHQTHFPLETGDLIGDRYIAYMRERARGGVGMLVIEAGAVHPSTDQAGLYTLYKEECVPGLERLSAAVHAHDTALFAQLSHLGSQQVGTSHLEGWHPLIAPSSVPSVVYGEMPVEMTHADIAEIAAGYGEAAANAAAGDCDGVEISAGHGYLMCQFLSPLTNRRQDEYGGSTENRCRFAIEAATEIRRRCGSAFPIGIRVSFDEFLGDAAITADIGAEMVATLHATGLFAYFSITAGNYHTMHQWVPNSVGGRDGHLAPHAKRAREVVSQEVPVMVAAGIRTVERAASIVEAGEADIVAMTRAHIADPHIVRKARSGRPEVIRRCVGANQGCLGRLFKHDMIACTVNPVAGREGEFTADDDEPSHSQALRVLVVGGGPAGMKAAESAAEQGHDVTLMERSGALGGQLVAAGRLPDRGTWLELVSDLSGSLDRLGVDVRLGTEVDAALARDFRADRTIVATGATFDATGHSIAVPGRRRIAGADSGHVLDPLAAIARPELCGSRVVIVDDNGDYLPLGLALLLAEHGRAVEVVTKDFFAGSRLITTGELPWVYPKLAAAGVRLTPQATVDVIEPGSVLVSGVWGGSPRSIDADTVILCMERRSNDSLHAELVASDASVLRIGDAVAPRQVDDAIYEGFVCGRRLAPHSL